MTPAEKVALAQVEARDLQQRIGARAVLVIVIREDDTQIGCARVEGADIRLAVAEATNAFLRGEVTTWTVGVSS